MYYWKIQFPRETQGKHLVVMQLLDLKKLLNRGV